MTSSDERRLAMVDRLAATPSELEPAWRAAWQTVPRERFVPYYFEPYPDRPGWGIVEDSAQWLEGVYSDAALVTQLDGDDSLAERARTGEAVAGTPTSSSSAPQLMASMLHALDVRDDSRVFEAATGTGYNAALLTERLSDDQVTTIEVDAGLTDRAHAALTQLGYHPTVRAGDALAGAVDRGPFDRVISTVAVPHVPQAWMEQTTPGAVLVVPLILAGHGGIMARLERTDQASASGTLLPDYGGFMATRQSPMPELPILRLDHIDHAQPSDLPIAALRDDHLAADFLALTAPPFKLVGFTPDDRSTGPQTWGRGLDGSQFVAFERDGHTHVATEGPLWSHLSEAYRRWHDHGRPDRALVHLTVTATGRHQLWLDASATVLREWGA